MLLTHWKCDGAAAAPRMGGNGSFLRLGPVGARGGTELPCDKVHEARGNVSRCGFIALPSQAIASPR